MIRSIRTKFAVIFIAVFLLIIATIIMINTLFLRKIYQADKMKALKYAYERIDILFRDSENTMTSDDYEVEFEEICSVDNLDVIIVDSSLNTVKSSSKNVKGMLERLTSYLFMDDPNFLFGDDAPKMKDRVGFENKTLFEGENYTIKLEGDYRMRHSYMELVGTLSSGDMIYLRTPMESIVEGARVTNKFFINVGLLAMFIGAIIIWFVATSITKPILKLSDISKKMTKLDFDAKYEGSEKNEIGLLGQNMNELSSTLEMTISELKTANNELKTDLEKRERLDEMRSEFVSNVSHELKTPLAIIQGYAEGLKDNVNDDDESRDFYCDVILDEAKKMNNMVKNLLSLNQLESGNDAVSIERFDLSVLIKNYLQTADILFGKKDIELSVDCPEKVFVWADEYKTETVLANYISNAINHVKEGGNIIISVTPENGIAHVVVFNEGENIPDDAIDNIWTKFYKADKSRSREYGGNGIGLSIVKAIMESFHMGYGVENREDGVAFYFDLDMENRC